MVGAILKGVAAILWPLVVAGALWGFRIEVRALLARLRRLGTKGAEFDENRLASQISAIPVEQALKEAAPLETHPALIVQSVTILRQELETLHQNSDTKRIDLLLLRVAEAQQIVDLQFLWLYIFASQIEALESMKASGVSIDLNPYYEVHQKRYEIYAATKESVAPPLNFEGWASFMTRNSVSKITDRAGVITDKGSQLLTFAAAKNLLRFQAL